MSAPSRVDEAALCRAIFGHGGGLTGGDAEPPEAVVPIMVAATGIAFERVRVQSRRLVSANRSERIALMLLWERGPSPVGDLAAGLDVTKSAMSQIVDRLVELGWAERSKDPADRRRTIVSLTGEAFAQTLPFWFAVARSIAQRLAASLTEEEVATVVRGYELVHGALIDEFERFSALSDQEMLVTGQELAQECRTLLDGASPSG
jgi:DNA-binding MarR family transcriptional regulator